LRPAQGDIRLLTALTTSRSWESLLAELTAIAAELQIRHVRFILSSQFVRYAVLPWQPGVFSGQDWQALGEHHMRKLYGAVAESWEVRVAMQGHGESAVVCAIDRALLSRLEDIASEFGWVVHGIEPALMAVFNHHRQAMPATDHWLLLAEPQRLLLAEVANGQWQQFSVVSPPAGQESDACIAMVERATLCSEEKKPAEVACFGSPALLPRATPDGIRLVRLPQPVKHETSTTLTMLAAL